MIKLLLNGACGQMGHAIAAAAAEREDCRIICGFDCRTEEGRPFPIMTDLSAWQGEADVLIDFSHPAALDGVLRFALERKMPVIVATTGLSADQKQQLADAAKQIPVFFSANMSIGINLLIELAKKAQSLLDGFDIEIIEQHHNRKIDAPSGTALAIADALNGENQYQYSYDRHSRREKRQPTEIGIHSVRGGTIVGEHSVLFAGKDEVITLHHSAASKEVFATGTIRAAYFLKGKPAGMYSMTDLVADPPNSEK